MSQLPEKPSISYRVLVHYLAQSSPSYKDLYTFISGNEHMSQNCAKFTMVTIHPDVSTLPAFHLEDFEGPSRSSYELQSVTLSNGTCRLFIVENLCAETTVLLGERFDIDPQFFADYLNNESWFRIVNVAKCIPALPSCKKLQDFLQVRYIETQTLLKFQHEFHSAHVEDIGKEVKLRKGGQEGMETEADRRSFMWPDGRTTNIPRKAGRLNPRTWKGEVFDPLLCTRQGVAVWFSKKESGVDGWTGIVLVDPPFKLPHGCLHCEPTKYRSFNQKPGVLENLNDRETPASNRKSLAYHLKERFADNSTLLAAVRSDCFLFLGDLYRLIASKWILINEYVDREMATIEYILEKEDPSFHDLEVYLKDLYIHRRRCTKYHELISQAKDQCSVRGQVSWSQSNSSIAAEHARDIEGDFTYLQEKTQGTMQRIEKNINLLASLVAIGAGKQSISENHGVARLNLLAIIFLPFSTIATILGMQGEYAPGRGRFWLFWAVAIPLTAGIFGLSVLYDGIRRLTFFRLRRMTKSGRIDKKAGNCRNT